MTSEPVLVRLGIRYFQALSKTSERPEAVDAVHFLNPDERKALRRIERNAILRAALAGAISTVIAAYIEVTYAAPMLGPRPRFATVGDQVRFWVIVGVATIVTSIIEILYLYWDGIRAVHRLSDAAGLDLFPNEDDDKAVAAAMARAALELPNPTTRLFGVNPIREASRFRLLVASLVYKLKISITNFLIKALVRRILGRAFVRGWLPFVAVPFTAVWNAFICWLIMREARIRAMGPSAAREMIALAFEGQQLSADGEVVAFRAVASSIVRTEDFHPNLLALLREVAQRGAVPEDATDLDDTGAFLRELARLPGDDQKVVLRVLSIASIIDGRLTRAERRLLIEARTACKRSADLEPTLALCRAFIAGDPIERQRITSLS